MLDQKMISFNDLPMTSFVETKIIILTMALRYDSDDVPMEELVQDMAPDCSLSVEPGNVGKIIIIRWNQRVKWLV